MIVLFFFQIKSGFSEGLNNALSDYREDGFKQAWDGLQSTVNYYSNYFLNAWQPFSNTYLTL